MNQLEIRGQPSQSSSNSSRTSLKCIVQEIDQLHQTSLQETSIDKLLIIGERLTTLEREVLSKMVGHVSDSSLDHPRKNGGSIS